MTSTYLPCDHRNMFDYIRSHYDITYPGNVDSLEEASEFFLATDPTDLACDMIHADLINKYASSEDCILTECIPSGQHVESKETFATIFLKTQAPIIGWDIDFQKRSSLLYF